MAPPRLLLFQNHLPALLEFFRPLPGLLGDLLRLGAGFGGGLFHLILELKTLIPDHGAGLLAGLGRHQQCDSRSN
jgi:hypothetical protein